MKKIALILLALIMMLPAIAQKTDNKEDSQYQASIIEYLEQDLAARQKMMQKYAEQKLSELPNNEKLYNESFIKVTSSLAEGTDEDGNSEMNYVYEISYNCKHVEGINDDYPVGAYEWNTSNSCRAICNLTKTLIDSLSSDYFLAGKKVTIKIHSTADGNKFVGTLPYKGEYGDFRYSPVTFNDEQLRLSVDQQSGITNNAQLVFIRAQSVKDFIEKNVKCLQNTRNEYKFVTRSYPNVGSRYRRTSIEIIVHNAFNERIESLMSDKLRYDLVDFNIPTTAAVYDNAYALIIINEDYNHKFLPNVPYAGNDGKVVKQYLTKALGVPERQIKVLTNASKKTIMEEGVHWLTDLAQAVATKSSEGRVAKANIFIYYAGHGITDYDGHAYLIPNNLDVSDITVLNGNAKKGCKSKRKKTTSSKNAAVDIALTKKETARFVEECISLDSLCFMLRGKDKRNIIPVNRLTIICDAGFDGHQRNGEPMLRCEKYSPEVMDNKNKKRKANKQSDAIVLLASTLDKTAYSYDKMHHGFMTYFLLKEIKGMNGLLDTETYQDIYESVQRNVNKESALQNIWQEIYGYVDGKYANSWQSLKLR